MKKFITFNNPDNSHLKVEVTDVFVVPNYQAFFKDYIDKDFGKTHKREWTQHQYVWEAVMPSQYFPNGVKMKYRKFSNDKVVIIDPKPKLCCKTPVGRKTGLEPKTVLSQWYPSPNLYRNRPVEGFYILQCDRDKLPSIPDSAYTMCPKPLVEKCVDVLDDLWRRLELHYTIGDPNRELWRRWFKKHKPINHNATDYIQSHRYECPLLSFFKKGVYHIPDWCEEEAETSFSIFPSYVVVATPSVQSHWDRQGAPTPYVVIQTGGNDDTRASTVLVRYGAYKLAETTRYMQFTSAHLTKRVNRKHKHNGLRYSSAGNKDKLALFLHECDANFFTMRFKFYDDYCDNYYHKNR
jgi:hypothetical protein